MPNYNTIDSYLVAIGWDVDYVSQRKMHEALDRTRAVVDRFSRSTEAGFLAIGGAFVAATTGIAAATVGLLHNVAQQDLGFQIYARRMLMSTDAAKKMKMATDALGVSLEEIIWGPPELAERYHQLIADQTKMLELLGSDRGEKAFRQIRDIEFQFTRMIPALKIFGMRLTEDIINKLAGSPESLEQRLKNFVDWFESPDGFVRISKEFSDVLGPLLKAMDTLLGKIFTKQHVEWAINVTTTGIDKVVKVIDWFESHPDVVKMLEKISGASAGALIGGPAGALFGAGGGSEISGWLGALKANTFGVLSQEDKKAAIKARIIQHALHMGIDPNAALAVAQQESGFSMTDPRTGKTLVGGAGEIGMFQVKPSTGQAEGYDNLFDLDENILAGLTRLREGFKKYGNWADAFAYYNGSGSAARAYSDQVMRRYRAFEATPQSGATVQPQAFHVGGVTVNVHHANATDDDIRRAVQDGIEKASRNAARQMYARAQGVYA